MKTLESPQNLRVPDDYQQLIADRCREHGMILGRSIDYIETGVCTGNSAEAVLSTGYVRFAVLIDHFSGGNYCGHFISKIQVEQRLAPWDGAFQVREGDSKVILPTVTEDFDVGFVDGDHTPDGCWFDMSYMFPRLRPNGIMFVDDLDGSGLKSTVQRFAEENNLQMIYHRVHEGLGELRRKI